jgi:hypothetical protein
VLPLADQIDFRADVAVTVGSGHQGSGPSVGGEVVQAEVPVGRADGQLVDGLRGDLDARAPKLAVGQAIASDIGVAVEDDARTVTGASAGEPAIDGTRPIIRGDGLEVLVVVEFVRGPVARADAAFSPGVDGPDLFQVNLVAKIGEDSLAVVAGVVPCP